MKRLNRDTKIMFVWAEILFQTKHVLKPLQLRLREIYTQKILQHKVKSTLRPKSVTNIGSKYSNSAEYINTNMIQYLLTWKLHSLNHCC